MSEPMIEAVGLTKVYGETLAVSGVSFSAARGETLGLLGANGSGKTTTMRILTGATPATSGTARVAGHDLATDSLGARRRIGYLPEAAPLYADMTVSGMLRFFGGLRRMGKERLAACVDETLTAFGLTPYRNALVGKLSKGYRQRAGFALAVLHEPDVLVLDEPTASIDPVQAAEARSLIRSLRGRHTVLLSTHQLEEAESLCDRVVVLRGGTVAAEGTPRDVARSAGAANLQEAFLALARGGEERSVA